MPIPRCQSSASRKLAGRIAAPVSFAIWLALPAAGIAAVNLDVVNVFQVDIQERFEGSELFGASDAGDPIAGPAGYYYYDDCFAQFGIEGQADTPDIEFVIDFQTARVAREGDALTIADGLTATRGEEAMPVSAVSLRPLDDIAVGDLHYLLGRLGLHCRTGE